MTFIVLVFLVIYLFYLTSRVSHLERMLDDSGLKTRQILDQAHAAQIAQAAQAQAAASGQQPGHAAEYHQPILARAEKIQNPQDDIFSAKTLTIIGVIALVFGIGFFFKLAIDRGWISEWGRIIIGLCVGALLMILGEIWRERFAKYASALAGGGAAIIYISFLLGNQLYNLYSSGVTFALLILTSALVLFAGNRYKSEWLNYESIAGAFLGPLLLYQSSDNHFFLFAYLTILNGVILYAMTKRFSNEILFLAGLGNAINFIAWATHYSGSDQNGVAMFVYLLATLLLFVLVASFLYHSAAESKKINPSNSDLFPVFLGLFGLYIFFAAEVVFDRSSGLGIYQGAIVPTWDLSALRAPFQLCAGLIYMIAYAAVDRLERKSLNYVLASFAALSLIISVYHQFHNSHLQTVLFIAIGLIGVAVSHIYKRIELAMLGAAVLFIAMLKSFADPYPMDASFIINSKFLVIALVSAAMIIANINLITLESSEFQDIGAAIVILAALNFWLGLSADLFHYNISPTQLLFSIWTLVFAVLLIAAGSYSKWRLLRKVSVGLFIFSILKVFLYDVLVLDIAFRVVSFITLGVILLSTSFYYQRHKERVKEFLK